MKTILIISMLVVIAVALPTEKPEVVSTTTQKADATSTTVATLPTEITTTEKANSTVTSGTEKPQDQVEGDDDDDDDDDEDDRIAKFYAGGIYGALGYGSDAGYTDEYPYGGWGFDRYPGYYW